MSLRSTATGDPTLPTVVFLHGLGVTSWMWDEQVALLGLADRGVTTAVARHASHAWVAEHPELFARMVTDWIEYRTVPAELAPATASAPGSVPRSVPRSGRRSR